MKKVWEHHFKYYDLFQNNSDRYKTTINFHLNELKNYSRILDAGTGSGNLTLELLKQGHEVTAIDKSPFALKILRQKCKLYNARLKVYQMDAQILDFREGEFDGASSMFVVPFIENTRKHFSEVYRVLRKGGKFTISAWAPVSDSWHGIVELQNREIERKGLLPKYKKEWNYQIESARVAVGMVLKGPNIKEIGLMLKEAGFNKIKSYKNNPYKKYAYFLDCEK